MSESHQDRTASGILLSVKSGPNVGQTFEFSSHSTFVVGRSRHAQLRLREDRKCSRFHTRFEFTPPTCAVLDLASRNGTLVNGKAITEATSLNDGDTVTIGETSIQVSISNTKGQDAASHLDETFIGSAISELPQLPGIELTRQIGEGGMGTVYHGIQAATGKQVAVKLLRPSSGGSDGMQQFIREASITMQLDHPRIVRSLEFGIHERAPFLVMEYVELLNVWDLLDQSTFSARMKISCGIVCRILEGLQYAHERHLVHRDVKPSNILTYMSGRKLQARLADFGLAKNFMNAGMSAMSTSSEVKGTLAYMPPEQVLDCRYAKPACDIYSAGACLYHYISGNQPHDFDDVTTALTKILNESPTAISNHCPDIPVDLVKVIEKSMAHEAADRFESAAGMLESLKPWSRRDAYR